MSSPGSFPCCRRLYCHSQISSVSPYSIDSGLDHIACFGHNPEWHSMWNSLSEMWAEITSGTSKQKHSQPVLSFLATMTNRNVLQRGYRVSLGSRMKRACSRMQLVHVEQVRHKSAANRCCCEPRIIPGICYPSVPQLILADTPAYASPSSLFSPLAPSPCCYCLYLLACLDWLANLSHFSLTP